MTYAGTPAVEVHCTKWVFIIVTVGLMLAIPSRANGDWYGPCGGESDCDDGNPCTTDDCDLSIGSCENTRENGVCCQSDADCFDGDPCTVEWCEGQPPNQHCEAHPLYPGCCYLGNVGQCDVAHDPCYTGGCTPDLHESFGGCTIASLCCTADGQCNDADDTTLDICDGDSCAFQNSTTWCSVTGQCPTGGKRIELLPGMQVTQFLNCDASACIVRTLWEHCGMPNNCPPERCCEVDADCDDQLYGTGDWCDTSVQCDVADGGEYVGSAGGTCRNDLVVDKCVVPTHCVAGDVAADCEDFSATIDVPICHEHTDHQVSRVYYCDENSDCQALDSLCSIDEDCAVQDACIKGVCGRVLGHTVGKCVYLPSDWAELDATQESNIQNICMPAHACKEVTCGLDFRVGPGSNECPTMVEPPLFDPELACTSFGPSYSHCVAQQLAGSDHECCTNDFDCEDGDPSTADRCIEGKCEFPVKLPCVDSDDDCMVSDCICVDAECTQLQCYGGCVLLMTCVDDGGEPLGEGDYCYPTIIADDGMSCSAFFDECFIDGQCDPLGVCEMPEPADWSCQPDGNECTIEQACDLELGCDSVPAPDGIPCVGPNRCQVYECSSGVCAEAGIALPDKVPCKPEETCQVHVCEQGQCVQKPSASLGTPCRPDGTVNPCKSFSCDANGECVAHADAPPETLCEVPCGDGLCLAGECDVTNPVADWTACPMDEECKRTVCLDGDCLQLPEISEDGTTCQRPDTCQEWTCQGGECRFDNAAVNSVPCSWEQSCYQWSCQDSRCEVIDEPSFGPQECSNIPPEESCVTWQCSDWVCLPDQVMCDDSNSCTEDLCVAPGLLESCIFVDLSEDCDDGNPCTDDSCDAGSGCVYQPNDGNSCDDSDVCNGNEVCQSGICVAGTPLDCDDSNLCTDDSCDPAAGCLNVPDDTNVCLDGDACNGDEYCSSGVCQPGPPLICDDSNPCTDNYCFPEAGCHFVADDSNSCNDGDVCTGVESCVDGTCEQGAPLDCDDGNECTQDSCDPATGCSHLPISGPCNDGDACTTSDYCDAGICQPGDLVGCGDTGNECSEYACDSTDGSCDVINLPGAVPCRPDDPGPDGPCRIWACDGNGQCAGGWQSLTGVPCLGANGGDPCKQCTCNGGSPIWQNASNETSCELSCGQGQCQDGTCLLSSYDPQSTPCEGQNPCGVFECDGTGNCLEQSTKPDGSQCPSRDSCRDLECHSGQCELVSMNVPGSECQWPGSCRNWSCSTDGICSIDGGSNGPVSQCDTIAPCFSWGCDSEYGLCRQEGSDCTGAADCAVGSCLSDGETCSYAPDDSQCDDQNVCTDDLCDVETGCYTVANTEPCDDINACTENDICSEGACGGTPIACDDSNPCTDDTCDPETGCVFTNNAAACDDENACTDGDICSGGTCQSGQVIVCEDSDPCTHDWCDTQNGCTFSAIVCSDANECTVDVCEPLGPDDYECSNPPLDCDDGNACTTDSCDNMLGCQYDTVTCDDGDPCTNDTCDPGSGCVFSPMNCDDGNACTADQCIGGACDHTPVPDGTSCPDGNACTIIDECSQGTCVRGPLECDDGNLCTDDSCDPGLGCVFTPNSEPCDDGSVCSVDDVCAGGACTPGAPLDCDDMNQCTDDSCDPVTGCTNDNRTGPCDDEDACTLDDSCSAGICQPGSSLVCNDENICTDDSCDPALGCVYDPNVDPCDDEEFCTEDDVCTGGICQGVATYDAAMIHGQVLDSPSGQPLAGVQIELAERSLRKCISLPDAQTDADGRFHLPVADRGLYALDFEMSGYVTSQRTVEVASGNGTCPTVLMVPLGTQHTIEANSGTDQEVFGPGGDMALVLPAGTDFCESPPCCETPPCCDPEPCTQDVVLTWYSKGEELPGPLPHTSHFTYAVDLKPEGLHFSTPIKVRVKNAPASEPLWAGTFTEGEQIPVGLWNSATGKWEHSTMATVLAGGWIEFETNHFSSWDINLPAVPSFGGGGGPSGGGGGAGGGGGGGGGCPGGCCGPGPCNEPTCSDDPGGSSIGRRSGNLRTEISLPGITVAGQQRTLEFTYDSSTAHPQVYLAGYVDTSEMDPGFYPESLRFRWMFEGVSGQASYLSCLEPVEGCPAEVPTHYRMATLLPAKAGHDGAWLSTGLYPYWLQLGTEHYGSYFWADFFGEPARAGNGTGRLPREPVWVTQQVVGTVGVVNRTDSPFGAGWNLRGHMEFHGDEFSGDKAIVLDGSIVRLNRKNRMKRLAGLQQEGSQNESSGDGGNAPDAEFEMPSYLARDASGNLYVSEMRRIRKITPAGSISTIAGCGSLPECESKWGTDFCEPAPGAPCDGVPADRVYLGKRGDAGGEMSSSQLSNIRVSNEGVVHFAEKYNQVIRRVNLTGTMDTVVGTLADWSYEEETSLCPDEPVCLPTTIELVEGINGPTVYYTTFVGPDLHRNKQIVRRVGPNGIPEDVTQAVAEDRLNGPTDMIVLADGTLLVAEAVNRVRAVRFLEDAVGDIEPARTLVTVFAGDGQPFTAPLQEGIADQTNIGVPRGLAKGAAGEVYIAATAGCKSHIVKVGAAESGSGDPPVGCTASPAPGCGGCACETAVCQEDAFCCQTAWDELCVERCRASGECEAETRYLALFAGQTDKNCEGTDKAPALTEGAPAKGVALREVHGLLWNDETRSLSILNRYWNSIWELDSFMDYAGTRFVSLTPGSQDGWVLAENNGTKHYFYGAANRHRKSTDRWGRTTRYHYDAEGRVEAVQFPYDRCYLLSYAGASGKISGAKPGEWTGAACSAFADAPETAFSVSAEGDLVTVSIPDMADKRFEYDENHLMVKRYGGPSDPLPQRSVEYVYDLGMVKEVWFNDPELPTSPLKNREYLHNRELVLASDGDAGVPPPQSPVGWDKVIDAEGKATLTRFDEQGRTLKVKDGNDKRTVYERNADGQISEICHFASSQPADNCATADYRETFSYDSNGNIVTKQIYDQQSPEGAFSEWEYGYAMAAKPLTNPDSGEEEDFEFTVNGTVINPEGELVMSTYDDYGNLTEVHLVKQWSEDQDGNIVVEDEYVATWVYSQPETGLPTIFHDPACVAHDPPSDCDVQYEYDALKNLQKVIQPDDSYVEYVRDEDLGSVSQVKVPVVVGEQTTATDAVWSLTRNEWGGLEEFSGPGVGPWKLYYTDPLTGGGCASCTAGSKLHRVVGPAAPDNEVAKYEYDLRGKVKKAIFGYNVGDPDDPEQDTDVQWVSYSYDNVGRLTDVEVGGTGSALQIGHDGSGHLDWIEIAKDVGPGIQWSYDPDALGRVKDVFAPDGGHWEYLYHYLGDVSSVAETETIPGPRTTTFVRDAVGRMTKRVLGPDEATDPKWVYGYDSLGRFVQLDDPTEDPTDPTDGTGLERDESGRVVNVKRDGPTVDSSLRDDHGRISWVRRVDGAEDYKYDLGYNAAGNISSVRGTWQEGNPEQEGAVQHGFLYDSGGRLSSLNMSLKQAGLWEPDVLRLDYGYDNSGRLAGISLGGGTHAVSLQRDAMGRLETVDYSVDAGAGLEPKTHAVYTYNDLNSWLTDIEIGTPDPNGGLVDTDVLDLSYSHDLAGRIVRIEEATGFAREFGYDDVSRLTSAADYDAAQGGDLLRTFGYTYNKVGERATKTLDTSTETYHWNNRGVLTSVTGGAGDRDFSFDLVGNLLNITPAAGQPTFDYDSSGRVKEVLTGDPQAPDMTVQYRYGPDERRTYRSIDGAVTRYFGDGLITYEVDGTTGALQRAYVLMPDGFTPVMLVTFENNAVFAVYFYHNDHLSTPRTLTNENGTVVWRARYAPFGATSIAGDPQPLADGGIGLEYYPQGGEDPVEQPLRFPGQWDDGVEGVWYNWHRFYLPADGMYARRDPVGDGVIAARAVRVRPWASGFGYCHGNPIRCIDPTGLWEQPSEENPFPMDPMQELFGPLGSPEDFVEFYEEVVLFERPDWDMPPPAEGATPFYNWDHKNLVLEDMELSSYQGPGSTWMHNYCADKREQCAMDCISGGDCGWSEPGPSDPCMEACIPVECDE